MVFPSVLIRLRCLWPGTRLMLAEYLRVVKVMDVEGTRVHAHADFALGVLDEVQLVVVDGFGVEGILAESLDVADVVRFELVHVGVLLDARDLLALGVVLVVQVVGLRL